MKRGRALRRRYGRTHSVKGLEESARATIQAVRDGQFEKFWHDFWMMKPTLESAHFDNLKYNDGQTRIWVSRQSLADYGGDRDAWLADRLTVEQFRDGRWVRV